MQPAMRKNNARFRGPKESNKWQLDLQSQEYDLNQLQSMYQSFDENRQAWHQQWQNDVNDMIWSNETILRQKTFPIRSNTRHYWLEPADSQGIISNAMLQLNYTTVSTSAYDIEKQLLILSKDREWKGILQITYSYSKKPNHLIKGIKQLQMDLTFNAFQYKQLLQRSEQHELFRIES